MLSTLAHVLPLGVAMAFSSVPVLVAIALLLSPRRRRTAPAFVGGLAAGLVLVTVIFTLGLIAVPDHVAAPVALFALLEGAAGAVSLVAGVLVLVLPRRPPGEGLPRWLRGIDGLSAKMAFLLALGMNLRPKALLMTVAAGIAIRAQTVDPGEAGAAIAFYVVVSLTTVAIPLVAMWTAPARTEGLLLRFRGWIVRNGRTITGVLLAVVGLYLGGDALVRYLA